MREKGSYYFIYKRTPKRRKLHFWEIFPDKFLVCGWRWPLVLETSNQLNTICAFIQFWLDLFRLKFRLYDMYFFYSFPDLFYWLIYATSFQAWLFTGSCDSMEGLLYLIWPPAFPNMMLLNAILSVLFNAMGQEIQLPLFLTCTVIPSV